MQSENDKPLIDRLSSKCFVFVMGVVFVAVYIFANTFLRDYLMARANGNTFVESNIIYVSEKREILQTYGEAGRAEYVRCLIMLDFIFPLQYSLFFSSCLVLLLKKFIGLKWQKVLYILGGVLCFSDWLENIFILIAISTFPVIADPVAILAQTMTLLKTALTMLFMLAIVISAAVISVIFLTTRLKSAKRFK